MPPTFLAEFVGENAALLRDMQRLIPGTPSFFPVRKIDDPPHAFDLWKTPGAAKEQQLADGMVSFALGVLRFGNVFRLVSPQRHFLNQPPLFYRVGNSHLVRIRRQSRQLKRRAAVVAVLATTSLADLVVDYATDLVVGAALLEYSTQKSTLRISGFFDVNPIPESSPPSLFGWVLAATATLADRFAVEEIEVPQAWRAFLPLTTLRRQPGSEWIVIKTASLIKRKICGKVMLDPGCGKVMLYPGLVWISPRLQSTRWSGTVELLDSYHLTSTPVPTHTGYYSRQP